MLTDAPTGSKDFATTSVLAVPTGSVSCVRTYICILLGLPLVLLLARLLASWVGCLYYGPLAALMVAFAQVTVALAPANLFFVSHPSFIVV